MLDYTQQAEQGSADRRHTHVVLESSVGNMHMTVINIDYYMEENQLKLFDACFLFA